MQKRELEPGDLVQLNPELIGNKAFAGCILVVTATYDWGVQGYVQALGEARDQPGGQAYLRVQWQEMELVGRAEWMNV